jgi:peptide deformylase
MIIINNETALRIVCQPVTLEEVGPLIEILEKELEHSNRIGRSGIGLAAPQIGIAKDIAIVRLPKVSFNLINAKLKDGFDVAVFKDEGCLSFPGRVADTLRYQEIYVTNNLVEPYSFIASGMLAVVCQHELDHLNSTLFIDRMVPKLTTNINNIKIGPNELCLCGSGKKYKKCCR